MSDGLLITFEGIEGCGKTTQIELLSKWLSKIGVEHKCFREPGSTIIGERIRKILLNSKEIEIEPMTELFLYLSARSALVNELVKPALNKGIIVILDRFTDSTIAYQGYGLGLNIDEISKTCSLASSGTSPDITFLLDIQPEVGLSRLKKFDRIEERGIEFLRRVRDGFIAIANCERQRVTIIDAEKGIEEVHNIIKQKIEKHIKSK
ncbi:MAG: dTMP kinase [bacterium]